MRQADFITLGLVGLLLFFAATAIVFGSQYDRPADEPSLLTDIMNYVEGPSVSMPSAPAPPAAPPPPETPSPDAPSAEPKKASEGEF